MWWHPLLFASFATKRCRRSDAAAALSNRFRHSVKCQQQTDSRNSYDRLTRVSVLPMRLRSTEATDATNIGLAHDLASCPIALLDPFATTASRFKTPSIKLVPSLHSSPSVAPSAPSSVARVGADAGCQPRTKFTGPKRIYHRCTEAFGSAARRAALYHWSHQVGCAPGHPSLCTQTHR